MGYVYRYNPTVCPGCGQDWKQEDSLLLEIQTGFQEPVQLPTQLTSDGLMVDAHEQVFKGNHSQTICRGCGNSLLNIDGVVEETTNPVDDKTQDETVDIKVYNCSDDFVDITVKRDWKCKVPGHHQHQRDNTLSIRKSEVVELVQRLDDLLVVSVPFISSGYFWISRHPDWPDPEIAFRNCKGEITFLDNPHLYTPQEFLETYPQAICSIEVRPPQLRGPKT